MMHKLSIFLIIVWYRPVYTGWIIVQRIIIAGANVVVLAMAGGKGVAMRAKAWGKVVVIEVDPLRALEATNGWFEVCRSKQQQAGDFCYGYRRYYVIRKGILVNEDGANRAN